MRGPCTALQQTTSAVDEESTPETPSLPSQAAKIFKKLGDVLGRRDMHSPPDEPGSPISEDSDTPPGDEPYGEPMAPSYQPSWVSSGSGGKRRLPLSGSFGQGSSSRNAKSRRQEDASYRRSGLTPNVSWQQSSELISTRAPRGEELVDPQQVDRLRQGKSCCR